MQANRDDVRALIERQRRRKVPEPIWRLVEDDHYIDEFLEHGDLGHVVARIDRLESALRDLSAPLPSRVTNSAPLPVEQGAETHGQWTQRYAEAMSALVAANARLDPEVVAFRHRRLPGGLLTWDEVEPWLTSQSEADGEPTQWVTFPAAGSSDVIKFSSDETPRGFGVSSRLLKYVRPGENHENVIATAYGGCLETLRDLSEGLARANRWTASQAVIFTLTGLTPAVGVLRTTEGGHNDRYGRWHAWAERIDLSVDPAVPVDDVVATYRAARQRFSRSRTEGRYKLRNLSPQMLRLVAFVAPRRPDVTWEAIRLEWNRTCAPEETYSLGTNFRRDALKASDRLLYRGLVTPARKR